MQLPFTFFLSTTITRALDDRPKRLDSAARGQLLDCESELVRDDHLALSSVEIVCHVRTERVARLFIIDTLDVVQGTAWHMKLCERTGALFCLEVDAKDGGGAVRRVERLELFEYGLQASGFAGGV